MKVYLASRYSRGSELLGYKADLEPHGIEVTSRWIDGRHETPPVGIEEHSTEHLCWAAQEDIADIEDADLLVAFTEPEGAIAGRGRGGRHVELGYALASGKHVIVCGHRENVFCHLPGVNFVPDWPSARAEVIRVAQRELTPTPS